MAENKLTDIFIRKIKPGATELTFGDGGGLWLRVLPAEKGGSINFYYRFNIGGKERRYNCGSYPATSLALARKRRNAARDQVREGIDPVQDEMHKRLERTAAQARANAEMTVAQLIDDWHRVYLSAHRKDAGRSVMATMRRDVLPAIGQMKARQVRLPHVIVVIDRILARNARRTANQVLSLMRQLFRHGLAKGIVDLDPTLGLTKKQAGGIEKPVERNLSFDEIKELFAKLDASDLPLRMQAATRLLLATGTRVGELLKARWRDMDFEARTWTIPAEHSKNGRAHLIHLSDFAVGQLALMKAAAAGPYLLGGRNAERPLSDKSISKAIRDRIRSTPLSRRTTRTGSLLLAQGEWSPHDLRRTMASRMGDLEIEPHVIERCLNHVAQGIVAVYQRQEYLLARRAAFDTWGQQLESLAPKARS